MTGSAFTARLVLARRLVTGVPTVLGAYALLFSTVSLQAAEPPAESAAATYLIDTLGVPVAPVAVRERTGWHEPRIILTDAKLSALLPQLRGIAPKARFVEMPEANARDIADADVALGVCTQEMLEQAKRIQWIQTLGAGVDRCVELPILHKRQPLVTNMQRVAAPSMAEHVIALMLALSRRLPYFMKEQEQGRWIAYKDAPLLADLDGKTVLIAGLGGIGTEVAKRAHALGMRVTATRARGRSGPEYVYYVGLPDELLKLTKDADFVVNCTPLTPKTKGIFNQEFFAAMKPTAYFISVGRGPSTVTADLITALQSGRIAGAGLDVVDPEPLPADDALWRMPNVIITPHVSSNTPLSTEVRDDLLRENLRRYVAGEPMLAVVDIERGY